MADPNVVNIKGLPRVEEIVEGNLLIVENEQGTNTLDFVNFVIGPNNTSFYNEISNLSAVVVSLSASTTSLVLDLSASSNSSISSLETTLNNRIDSLSATVSVAISGYFYTAGKTTFNVGATTSTLISILKPAVFNIEANDITLTLGSSGFPTPLSGFPVPYLFDYDIVNTGTGTTFFIRLTHAPVISALDIRYKIFKPFDI
jgi:hypothetical protein